MGSDQVNWYIRIQKFPSIYNKAAIKILIDIKSIYNNNLSLMLLDDI